jgi:hypothetical protein
LADQNFRVKRGLEVGVGVTIQAGIVTAVTLLDGNLNAPGKTYYVSTNGNDGYAGTTINRPFATIAKALSVSTSGDTIFVQSGTFTEVFPLTIPVGVNVKGTGLRGTFVQPTSGTRQNDGFLLNGETTIEDLTIGNINEPGYAFKFANNSKTTTRSPYVQRVTVLNKGSITSATDPYGFDTAHSPPTSYKAGRGVLIDGSVVDPTTLEPAMLFNECTFICPNNTALEMTNGGRTEWVNCFSYFADKGIRAYDGSVGVGSTGYVRVKTSGLTGSTPAANDELYYLEANYRSGTYSQVGTALTITRVGHGLTVGDRIFADFTSGTATDGFYRVTGYVGVNTFSVTMGGSATTSGNISYKEALGFGTVRSYTSATGLSSITAKGEGLFELPTSRLGKTVTAYGDAQLSTLQKKIGTASLYLDGTGDYARCEGGSDFTFAGNFTAEAWIYPTSVTGSRHLFALGTETTGRYHFSLESGVVTGNFFGSASTTFGGSISINTWTHIALVRSGSTITAYVNGTALGTTETNSSAINNTGQLTIGADNSGTNAFVGYIDEVRISNTARYTATFTPSTTQFNSDGSDKLLLHLDGASASTSFIDSSIPAQDIRWVRSGVGIATATKITLADYQQFGAEMRSIGSAVVFGNTGISADGPGVGLRMFAFNFGHIGSGKDFSQDVSLVNQAAEVVKTNNANVYFVSIDQSGDFRVGDAFYVNQEAGTVNFGGQNFTLNSLSDLNVTDGTNTNTLTPTYLTVGNIQISGNEITSTSGNININPSGNSETNIDGNLNVSGILTASVLQTSALQIGDTSIAIDDTGSNGTIRLNTDGLEVLRATNTQRVGIGTIVPTAKLDVLGDTRITGVITAITFSGNVNGGVGTITNLNSTTGNLTTLNATTGNIVTGIVTTISGTNAFYNTGTLQTGNIVTGVVTTLSGTNATYTTGNFGTANATTGNIVTGVVTTISGTNAFYNTGTLQTGRIVTGIVTTLFTSGTATIATGNIVTGVVTTLSGSNATYTTGNFGTANATTGNIVTGVVTTLSGTNVFYNTGTLQTGNIVTGVVTTLSGSNATYTTGNFTTANATTGNIVTGVVTTLSGSNATYTTGNFGTANATTGNIVTGVVTTLSGTNVFYNTGTLQTGNIVTGVVTTLSGSNATYTTGNFTTANATTGNIVTGIVTTISGTNAFYNTGTLQTGNIVTGIVTTLFTSGTATIATGNIVTGVVTTLSGSNATYTTGNLTTLNATTGNIVTGVVTTLSGSNATYTTGNLTTLNATTGNIVTGVVTTLSVTQLNVSGVSTFASNVNLNAALLLPQNPTGVGFGTTTANPQYAIRQTMGDNDGWQIFGESPSGTNTGSLVLEVNDDVDTNERIIFRNRRNYSGAVIGVTTFLEMSSTSNIIESNSLLIGTRTLTGTSSQRLQVTGGAYVSGNLGIGNTNPQNPLHISGTQGTLLRIDGGSGGTGTRDIVITEFDTPAYGGIIRYDSSQDTFTIGTLENSVVQYALNIARATGNVGVGYTQLNPTVKLAVNGTTLINTNSLTGTASQPLQVNGGAYVSGSVGIGTTNPTSKLDVVGDIKLTGQIQGPSELIIDPAAVGDNTGAVRIKGDLYVDGTQFVVNSTTIELADFNVGIATTVGTNALLDGAGIGIGSTGIRKTITWNNTASALTSSEDWNLVSGKQYEINGTSVLSSTTLGSGVVNSSLTSVGTLGSLNVTGTSNLPTINATTGYIATGVVTTISGTNAFYNTGTLQTGNIVTGVVTTLSGSNATYTTGNFGTANATTGNIVTGVVTTLIGTSAFYNTGTLQTGNIVTGVVTTLSGTNATYTTGNLTTLNATTGNIVTGVVTTLSGTNATYTTGNLTTLNATTGNIVTGVVTTISGTNAFYNTGTLQTGNIVTGIVTTISGTNAFYNTGTLQTGNIVTGVVTTLSGTSAFYNTGTLQTGNIVTGVVTTISGTNAFYNTGTLQTGNIVTGVVTTLSGSNATYTTGNLTTLNATTGNIVTGVVTTLSGTNIRYTGIATFGNTVVGGATTQLVVTGNARVTGILTVGTASITLDGTTDVLKVGSGVTIYGTTGIVSATKFYGDGSSLIGVSAGSTTWTRTNAGIHTLSNVGIGTTNPTAVVTSANTAVLAAGIVTAYKIYGDGSGLTGVGFALTVGTRTAGINSTDAVSNVRAIRFAKAPFAVQDLGNGEVLINSESSFNPIIIGGNVNDKVQATGEETLNLVAGSGITIVANNTSNPKSLTFTATGGGGGSGISTQWVTTNAGIHTLSNVGIGTTNPNVKLDVLGNVRVVGILTATSLVKSGGTSSQFLKADGSVDSSIYLTSYTETDTLNSVTNRGNTTSNSISVGILTATVVTAKDDLYTEWTLGSNGSSDYTFTGPGFTGSEFDPTIYLIRGKKYRFTNTMGAHPFRIQSTPNGSLGTQYNDGITNNDVLNGTLTWEVRHNAPSTLYYQCTAHAAMGGVIYILNEGTGGGSSQWVTTNAGINTTSNVGIATATPTSKLHVIGDVLVVGVVTATDFNSSSDAALKNNVRTIKDPLEKVMSIRGVNFEWKESCQSSAGVLAQEIEKIMPELVNESNDGIKSVNYNGLIGLLIEVVKEQQNQINELKSKLS